MRAIERKDKLTKAKSLLVDASVLLFELSSIYGDLLETAEKHPLEYDEIKSDLNNIEDALEGISVDLETLKKIDGNKIYDGEY